MTKVELWESKVKQLKILKEEELELRKDICLVLLKDKGPTAKIVLADGRTLKAIIRINNKLDEAVLTSIWSELSEREKQVFEMKPKLRLAFYKKLPDDSLVHEAVTQVPSPTPVLELK